MTAPGCPRSAPPGRAPNTTKKCRWNWCQRTLQKSRTDVAIHGRRKNGGQSVAGWRRRIRPINIATWYIRSICAYVHRARKNVASGAENLPSKKGRPVSMRLSPPVLSMEELIKCNTYCAVSRSVNFKSVLAKTEAIDGGGVLLWGNGREDHDHPIPR